LRWPINKRKCYWKILQVWKEHCGAMSATYELGLAGNKLDCGQKKSSKPTR